MSAAATFCATLVDEWVRLGVRRGRRSRLAQHADGPGAGVASRHDRARRARRAGGCVRRPRDRARQGAAVLLCTSGTAAANFHPAVVEAGLSEVPMLVVTADRPPELQMSAPRRRSIRPTCTRGPSGGSTTRSSRPRRAGRRGARWRSGARRPPRSGAPQPAVPRAAHRGRQGTLPTLVRAPMAAGDGTAFELDDEPASTSAVPSIDSGA